MILISCKSEVDKNKELILKVSKSYLEDFHFKENRAVDFQIFELVDTKSRSFGYLDTLRHYRKMIEIENETENLIRIVDDLEEKVNTYIRFKTLSRGETDLTRMYKGEAEAVSGSLKNRRNCFPA